MTIYLDNASTTPIHPEALEAFIRATTDTFGDPSRLYGEARRARIALDAARDTTARTIGARAEEIVFTGGGTESCNLAVSAGARAAAAARKPKRIVVSAVEHTAVLHAARALEPEFEVVVAPVDGSGRLDLEGWRAACEGGTGLASIQLANPEVGTIQPVAEAAEIARGAGAVVHTDACAALGRVGVDVRSLGVDLVSGSSHKAYGPKGAGLLWVKRGVRVRPSMVGDDRERGRRAGIENLPAAAGFAAALLARATEIPAEEPRLRAMAARLRDEIRRRVPGVVVHGRADGVPGLVAFSVLYVEGEALLLGLDRKGIAVHSGSSCTSSVQEPSHVLAAMGAITQGSLRVSMGRDTTDGDIDAFVDALPDVVARARELAGSSALVESER
ncbi:MAG: cysteine desulfurase family protein [Actinomycetota bacterium]